MPAFVAKTAFPTYSDDGSATPSFGQSTTAGNLLVAFASSNDSAESYPITVSGSGWTLAVSDGGPYLWAGLYYKADCGSGETPPTFSDSGDETVMVTAAAEYSGVATSSPLDQTGATVGNPVTASGVDSAGSDLIVALFHFNGSNADPTVSMTLAGSDGVEDVTVETLGTSNGNGREAPPYWFFGAGVAPSALGTDANEAVAEIDEFENSPVELIASFKAA